jgi:hypothetical protein
MQPIYYVTPIQTAALDLDDRGFFLRGREMFPCDHSFVEGWAADQTPSILKRRGECLILVYLLVVARLGVRRVALKEADRLRFANPGASALTPASADAEQNYIYQTMPYVSRFGKPLKASKPRSAIGIV